MNKYLDFFDAVYYINLDHRTDRKENFEKRALKVGIEAIRFSAIIDKVPVVSCALSHQAIIKIAKKNGLKNVLIFEDDCFFLDNYKEYSHIYIDELKKIDWGLFYFGGEPNYNSDFITENLAKISSGYGVYQAHSYAVNNTCYDVILNYIPHRTPADIALLHADCIKIIGKNCLTIQDNTFSDLQGCDFSNRSSETLKCWKKSINREY